MIWRKDCDVDGSLRYVLSYGPGFLPLCVLTRYSRRNWTLICADRVVNMYGKLREVKSKAEGMLGL